jgi:hypothetical protein
MSESGRPSKYDPKYCDIAIELGKKGKTLVHIANEIGVAKMTLNVWARDHNEFFYALQRCKALNEQFWLDLAEKKGTGKGKGSDTIIKFMLSAAHGYRERTDVISDNSNTNSTAVELSFVDVKPE